MTINIDFITINILTFIGNRVMYSGFTSITSIIKPAVRNKF